MASTRILLIFAAYISVGHCFFYSLYILPMVPYGMYDIIRSGWKYCPDNFTTHEKYKDIVDNAMDCIMEPSNSTESLCHTFENNIQKCTRPVLDLYSKCLPKKSRDFPPALVEAATALLKAACASKGEILLESINDCLFVYFDKNDEGMKKECSKEYIDAKLSKLENKIPSKYDACYAGHLIADCWRDSVYRTCKSREAKELFSKFYEAVFTPCNK